jgi:hypothetical protein
MLRLGDVVVTLRHDASLPTLNAAQIEQADTLQSDQAPPAHLSHHVGSARVQPPSFASNSSPRMISSRCWISTTFALDRTKMILPSINGPGDGPAGGLPGESLPQGSNGHGSALLSGGTYPLARIPLLSANPHRGAVAQA